MIKIHSLPMFKGSFTLFLIVISIKVFSQELKQQEIPQEKFYSRIEAGYNFVPWTDFEYEYTYKNDEVTSVTTKRFSFGKGLNLGTCAGVWLNKVVGLELGISYLVGGRNKTHHYYDIDTYSPSYHINQTRKEKMNVLRFGPGIIFKADIGKISPYGKLNIWYGVGSGLWEIDETYSYSNGSSANGEFEWKVKGVRTFGFASSLGIKFHTRDYATDFFIEFLYTGMGGTYQSASRTVYRINGQDQLNTLTTSQKEIIYVDQLDYTQTQSPNQPFKSLKTLREFGSYGINMGFFLRIK